VVWHPLFGGDGLWHAQKVVMGVELRSVALRLADGRLAVTSPIRDLGDGAHSELAALGRPAALVAPNHFHNLGLREYARAYPDAIAVASAQAVPRVRRLTKLDVADEGQLAALLPAHASLLVPPGTRNGEMWLSVVTPGGRAWIVGDAFFNVARTPRTAMGLLLRALSITPGLRIGTSFRWLVHDHAAYRRFVVDALAREQPALLAPCHGDVLDDPGLAGRLQHLVEARF
jgi:hypothetical protein